jgi:phytoene desaturase
MAKISIIGTGVAGLAAAIRMAVQGHEVDVFEANSYPGGKLSEFALDGYRFDAGPSLFTMPRYVDELIRLAGRNPADYFEYERLPVVCQYFWEDGTELSAFSDIRQFADEVEKKLDIPGERVVKMLRNSERKYDLTGRIFLEKSLHKASTWLSRKVAQAMLQLPSFDLFTTMNRVHERQLQHPKLVQLFNRFATYNGSNPYKAPGLLTIIPHFEHALGAYYPKGGMVAITNTLHQLGKELGVRYHFNQPVTKIVVDKQQATGLIVGGKTHAFDTVICNMDVFFAYRKLLADQPQPERTLKQEKSTSALIFYWGIKRNFPQLDLHNIFFSDDYRTEFDHLAAGTVYEDPTVYVNISSKYSPGDAPPGGENWFTMVNVPYDDGQDWDAIIPSVRRQTLAKLSRILGTDVEALIACEDLLEPRTIESKTRSHLGALYGTSSNDRMAAFMRHPNFSRSIDNLYFCGGSVHPGGGIPLSLLSARIIDELMHGQSVSSKTPVTSA